MKKWIAALLLCVLSVCIQAASAEVYINEAVPEDWPERVQLRLVVVKIGANDAMLLQCGGESMFIDGGTKKYDQQVKQAITPYLEASGGYKRSR